MKRIGTSVSIVLALSALAVAVPSLALAAPPITETDAIEATQQLVARVGGYSARHPDAPGGCAPWTDGDVTPRTPLLVHTYPDLEPSYYYTPLESERGDATFVTVDARTGQWQAFGNRAHGGEFPRVTREAAARSASDLLGARLSPSDLRAVGMPNKHLYWQAGEPGGREVFINIADPSDIHIGLDEDISPPQPSYEPPADAAERSMGWEAPGAPDDGEFARDYPASYDIAGVPYHVQQGGYDCGPASAEMVMDYWGVDIDQQDIADVANCLSPGGSYNSDIRRSGHFSAVSTAIQNASLQGYDERKLGYAALDQWWSLDTPTDPDFATRYEDLKTLISSDYPLLVLTYYNTPPSSGHFRVVKGYNDSTNVFIAHDPWYSDPYQGPDVNFNQTFFVDTLWTACWRWATLIMPWEVQVSAPDEVDFGETFTVQAIIYYHGPHPFEGQDPAGSREVIIDMSSIFTLAPGETAIQTLPGSVPSGMGNLVTWDVVADSVELGGLFEVVARGLISDTSWSYSSYSDSIGGWGCHGVTIINQSGIDDSLPMELVLHAARPSPFSGTTTMQLDVPLDAGHVTLAVYNVRGQLVRTLVDGALPPGRREFTWNGTDDTGRPVSAGVYLVRCESDAGSGTQKLVLMK